MANRRIAGTGSLQRSWANSALRFRLCTSTSARKCPRSCTFTSRIRSGASIGRGNPSLLETSQGSLAIYSSVRLPVSSGAGHQPRNDHPTKQNNDHRSLDLKHFSALFCFVRHSLPSALGFLGLPGFGVPHGKTITMFLQPSIKMVLSGHLWSPVGLHSFTTWGRSSWPPLGFSSRRERR